ILAFWVDDHAATLDAGHPNHFRQARVAQHALRVVAQNHHVGSRSGRHSLAKCSGDRNVARMRILPIEPHELLLLPEDSKLARRPPRGIAHDAARVDTGAPAFLDDPVACLVLAYRSAEHRARAQGGNLPGDVRRSSEAILDRARTDHGNGCLRRHTLHRALHVLVEHEVPDDPDLAPRAAIDQIEQMASLVRAGDAADLVPSRSLRSSASQMMWMHRMCTS